MGSIVEAAGIYDSDVGTGVSIGTYTVRRGGTALRFAVEFDTDETFGLIVTPPGGSPLALSLFNKGAGIGANQMQTFLWSGREGAVLDFRHGGAGTVKVKQLLVDEVRDGVI